MKIINSGQTGVGQAALRVARKFLIDTGGLCPAGFRTEAGNSPWLQKYGIFSTSDFGFDAVHKRNSENASATIWIGSRNSPEYISVIHSCWKNKKPMLAITPEVEDFDPKDIAMWIFEKDPETLHICGSSESLEPGIGLATQNFLVLCINEYMDLSNLEIFVNGHDI